MKRSTSGFTVIELLIVISIIGILAGIVYVSYGSTQRSARNADRLNQVHEWNHLFALYKAKYGKFPAVTDGNYCLGTNFPKGPDNQNRCRNSAMTDPTYSYLESTNTTLMNEIKKIGSVPTNNPIRINNDLVGPYVNYWNSGYYLTQVFEGGASDCPQGMSYSWDDGNGSLLCSIEVDG